MCPSLLKDPPVEGSKLMGERVTSWCAGLEQTLARLSQSFQLDRSEIKSPAHHRKPSTDGKHEALTEVRHQQDVLIDGDPLGLQPFY